ncbi:MAG: Gfo/Idh/MocA family oxidoreductase, partial [Cyanobacteria bacterium P01_H01_bin.130]
QVGQPVYGRYSTIAAKRPAPKKWTFSRSQFGFPLVGALSRIHRLTHAFGQVEQVSAAATYWDTTVEGQPLNGESNGESEDFYGACWVGARLNFAAGPIFEVLYGKGDRFAQSERRLEVRGTDGTLIFKNSDGVLLREGEAIALEVGGKRGSFRRDTAAVLDAFLDQKPLYVTPQESLYSLQVADAARHAAETHRIVNLLG